MLRAEKPDDRQLRLDLMPSTYCELSELHAGITPPGSYGSLLNPVFRAVNGLSSLIERNPDSLTRLFSFSTRVNALMNFEWQQGNILVDGTHDIVFLSYRWP